MMNVLGGMYPLLAAGLMRLVFYLLALRPQPWATVTALTSAGIGNTSPLDGVKQDMDVSCSSFGDSISQVGAGQSFLSSSS